jgi:4-alpha-glucanotransferase
MLRRLANSYGVQTRYLDVNGKLETCDPEIVVSVLRSLGAPLSRLDEAADALEQRRIALCRRVLPPVAPLWKGEGKGEREGGAAGVRLTLPARLASRLLSAKLLLEDGDVRDWSPNARTVLRSRTVDGTDYLTTKLPLPTLPVGYHRLIVDVDGVEHETLLVRAPTHAFRNPARGRRWGLFAPLYALHSRDSHGIGNFADLERLMHLTRRHGGDFVSTLPFFASLAGEPSPYSPMSRLFWNELYINTGDIGGGGRRPTTLLDVDALARDQRAALEAMPRDRAALDAFIARFPLALDYARFRAFAARHGTDRTRWPETQRAGVIVEGDVDESEVVYHLYNQLRADGQLADLRSTGVGLYLDLPLGVHRDGYDTWREQTLFAADLDVGAPPDAAFPSGQNWGTPPVLPHKSRAQGHRYLRLAFRQAMRHATMLRVDHIMGLHRQFWIPRGADVADGVYVRYPAEELYAILIVESVRARCELIGENLGIVPEFVNLAMKRHGLSGLHVEQLTADSPIPEDAVASLNTHDTATFAAYITAMGHDDPQAALRAALSKLMKSAAHTVNVAVEDLWLELEPHNVPGTTSAERPNWRRPMRYSLEELETRIGPILDGFVR